MMLVKEIPNKLKQSYQEFDYWLNENNNIQKMPNLPQMPKKQLNLFSEQAYQKNKEITIQFYLTNSVLKEVTGYLVKVPTREQLFYVKESNRFWLVSIDHMKHIRLVK